MRIRACWIALCCVVLSGLPSPGAGEEWIKGNTHCHSNVSDGDLPPEEAIRWYRDHGYGFVVLTDHRKPAPLSVFEALTDGAFVAIPGEEVTTHSGPPSFTVHLNALGIRTPIEAVEGPDVATTLLWNASRIISAGGLVQVNHPAFHLRDPDALPQLGDPFLIEVHNDGVRTEPMGKLALWSFEAAWDRALSAGRRAWAVASDDAHRYRAPGKGDNAPGGGWVMVRVTERTEANILRSLARGDFYASTGVEVADYGLEGSRLRVRVRPAPGVHYAVRFIGMNGRTLHEAGGTAAEYHYHLSGRAEERYVRVRIRASNGATAWLQPVWPRGVTAASQQRPVRGTR